MVKQIFSILFSFILLAGHSHLTIGMHFCGGEAVESKIVLGELHLACDMMDIEESCDDSGNSNKSQASFDNNPCCETEYQTIQPPEDIFKDATQIAFNIDFAVAPVYSTLNPDLFPKTTHLSFRQYHSPPIEKDIQVLLQTFLI